MVGNHGISNQLIYRMKTAEPVLYRGEVDIDHTSHDEIFMVEYPNRSILDSVVIETSKLARTPYFAPPYGPDIGTVIGHGRTKKKIEMKIPFMLPSNLPMYDDEEYLLGASLGGVLSGSPISIHNDRYGDMMRDMISSYRPQTIFKWAPGLNDIDLDLMSSSDGVEISLSKNNPLPVPVLDWDSKGAYAKYPSVHPEITTGKDLKDMVQMIRQVNQGPIIGTLSASDVESDLDYLLVSGVDCVHVICGDNIYLRSGAVDPFSRDILSTLVEIKKHFDTFLSRKEGVKLMISGPFLDANDVLKALCMGADIIGLDYAISRSLILIKEGYISNEQVGYDREIIGWDIIGEYINNLFLSFSRELSILLGALGIRSKNDLDPKLLRSVSYDSAAVTGLPLIGYGEKLGMWRH